MIVKEKFDLLKGIDNVMSLSKNQIKEVSVDRGAEKIFVNLEFMKNRINHYTKDKIFKELSSSKTRDNYLHVVNLPNYPLPISYNKPTKGIIINLSPFGINDIETTKPGVFNLYALMVYGIVFRSLLTGQTKVSSKTFTVISNFLVSVLIRLFGKQYGLLGSFATQIPKMKFLTNVYILESFFGETGINAYKKASVASSFNYREIAENLPRYDFKNISDFIKALSDFQVMPNMNKHIFAAKTLRFFGLNVMPAFEDFSRFVATLSTADIKGSNVISTYLSKYNERDFAKVLEITKKVFRS
jgi:hypothetical protein